MTISSVTSEALQLKLRQLLPSQQGFGGDLSASDTIIPIIDLTQSAEGSDVRPDLQSAIAHGNATVFSVTNAATTVNNTPGFYRIYGACTVQGNTAGNLVGSVNITDGVTNKKVWGLSVTNTAAALALSENIDIMVFLAAGDSLIITSSGAGVTLEGSTRQIATAQGVLVNPTGFNPQ